MRWVLMSERAVTVEGFDGRGAKGIILRGGGLVEEVSGERRARDHILWRSSKGRWGKRWKALGRVLVLGVVLVLESIVFDGRLSWMWVVIVALELGWRVGVAVCKRGREW
jgi:hypothetical protein